MKKNKKNNSSPAAGAVAVIAITVFTIIYRSYLMSLEGDSRPYRRRHWDDGPKKDD